jgi:hypothetical protein
LGAVAIAIAGAAIALALAVCGWLRARASLRIASLRFAAPSADRARSNEDEAAPCPGLI